MKTAKMSRIGLFALLAMFAVVVLAGWSPAAGKKAAVAAEQKAAYKLFKKKCLDCHVSVADPERPGKTRDGWMVVIKYMDSHYIKLSPKEADKLVDFLFYLRQGLEKEAG